MSNTQSGGCEVNCGAELVDAFLGAMMRMLTQPVAGAEQGANELRLWVALIDVGAPDGTAALVAQVVCALLMADRLTFNIRSVAEGA
ncbi:hypothetical protein Q1695_004081 [Nippostrongylus brasiliensis]|nr:hypothetical protein Q1695_004081 [Nippostrongylus brasiliensis]